jgi:hypothetical protein
LTRNSAFRRYGSVSEHSGLCVCAQRVADPEPGQCTVGRNLRGCVLSDHRCLSGGRQSTKVDKSDPQTRGKQPLRCSPIGVWWHVPPQGGCAFTLPLTCSVARTRTSHAKIGLQLRFNQDPWADSAENHILLRSGILVFYCDHYRKAEDRLESDL